VGRWIRQGIAWGLPRIAWRGGKGRLGGGGLAWRVPVPTFPCAPTFASTLPLLLSLSLSYYGVEVAAIWGRALGLALLARLRHGYLPCAP
jgi:hypothetical protein